MNNKKLFLNLLSDDQPDLATGALLIARHFHPTMDIDEQLSAIDHLTATAQKTSVADGKSLVSFFSDTGFHGNKADYYDVNNSFLNQVLERKIGIPITLAVVYLAVVKRMQLPTLTASGVNFPGHFLISVQHDSTEELIDVFDAKVTNETECYARAGTALSPDPLHFRRATDRDILSRILENLKAIYWQADDPNTVLDCLDYQLMIFPDSARLLEQQQRLLQVEKSNTSGGPRLH